jgi:hypothetical protein
MLDFLIQRRGLIEKTIREFSLGLVPLNRWADAKTWGVDEILKDNGKPKKYWIPRGLTIPLCQDDQVLRVRVRRPKSDGDPRYYLLRGSDTRAMVLGINKSVSVLVESELDGLLLHQEAGDLVNVLSLGNAQTRPDQGAAETLNQSQLILVSLDADQAGATESWRWWKQHYPQAHRWPSILGKDPGEMWTAGVSIRTWVEAGLMEYAANLVILPERHHQSGLEEENILVDGVCLFHHCDLSSYQSAALFCGERKQLVIDMARCPLGLWCKDADGWPVTLPTHGIHGEINEEGSGKHGKRQTSCGGKTCANF